LMSVALIAAVDSKLAIGKAGALPWHIPEDLVHFKRLTLHQTILMGRKTYDSIGRALPKRRNLVLTRDPHFSAPGVELVHTMEQAIALAENCLWVIGGGEIYALALPFANRIELTRVDLTIDNADAFFPSIPAHFKCVARHHGESALPKLLFERLERI
jgi:dihydrofolate reductase